MSQSGVVYAVNKGERVAKEKKTMVGIDLQLAPFLLYSI